MLVLSSSSSVRRCSLATKFSDLNRNNCSLSSFRPQKDGSKLCIDILYACSLQLATCNTQIANIAHQFATHKRQSAFLSTTCYNNDVATIALIICALVAQAVEAALANCNCDAEETALLLAAAPILLLTKKPAADCLLQLVSRQHTSSSCQRPLLANCVRLGQPVANDVSAAAT